MVEALAGGQITLDDGTVVNILNSGGNQGLLATGTNSRIIANNITETATVGGGDFGVHALSGGEIDVTSRAFNFNGTGGGETVELGRGDFAAGVEAMHVTVPEIVGQDVDDVGRPRRGRSVGRRPSYQRNS